MDLVSIVSAAHKKTGSTEGHAIAPTSPLQIARVEDTPRRLDTCRRAILGRDFNSFASIVELDSDMMHAVMMTSTPALHYWKPASLAVMNFSSEKMGDKYIAIYKELIEGTGSWAKGLGQQQHLNTAGPHHLTLSIPTPYNLITQQTQ